VIIHDGRDDSFNLSVRWSLEIIDFDRPFTATFDPMPGNLSIDFGEILNLSFDAMDPDGTEVLSEWSYPGHIIPEGNVTDISFDHRIVGLGGGDWFNVTLMLQSGDQVESYQWHVEIGEEPVIPQPVPDPVPPQGVSILSPAMDETFTTEENVILKAGADDPRNLSYTWYLDLRTYNGSEVKLDPMGPGNYTVFLNVTSMDEDAPGWLEVSIDFVVVEPVIQDDPAEVDDEDDNSMIFQRVIVIVVLILIILIVILARRRSYHEFEE
jgi:hypothetical protein